MEHEFCLEIPGSGHHSTARRTAFGVFFVGFLHDRRTTTPVDRSVDDLTGTVFAGHHQPLSIWMLCLYFMGLTLSNRQIAAEREIHENSIQETTIILRSGIVAQEPSHQLESTVECDEVYIVAGHKGHPESVRKKGERPENEG